MSIHEARIAHWRIARNPAGKEIELRPWLPGSVTMLKTATIRHCVGCVTCGEAVETDPPCTDPRWCRPEHPCAGLRTALEWARGHVDGTAAAVVTTAPEVPEPPKTPAVADRRPWTAEEDAWVLAHPNTPARRIAKDLGRSVGAVHTRRRDLGATTPTGPRWTEYEDRLLRGCTFIRDAMAALPGRTRAAIKHRAGLIGHSFRRTAA